MVTAITSQKKFNSSSYITPSDRVIKQLFRKKWLSGSYNIKKYLLSAHACDNIITEFGGDEMIKRISCRIIRSVPLNTAREKSTRYTPKNKRPVDGKKTQSTAAGRVKTHFSTYNRYLCLQKFADTGGSRLDYLA